MKKQDLKRYIIFIGSDITSHCLRCNKEYQLSYIKAQKENRVPKCSCGGVIKPDIVFFGESLNEHDLQKSIELIEKADILLAIGTSLTVYPVAGLVRYYNKDKFGILNLSETPYDIYADLVINDELTEIFSKIN